MQDIAFDPTDHSFVRNPYPTYAALRELSEPARNREGMLILTRHADVLAAVRDPRMSSNPRHSDRDRGDDGNILPMLSQMGIELMLIADPPDHTRLRRLANKAFTPRAVEALRPRVTELVDGLLDLAADKDECDLMAALAEPLPVLVICELLGVPSEDQEQFKPWSSAVARMLDGAAEGNVGPDVVPAVMGFVTYFQGLIEERRAVPRDDLLSALIQAEAEGDTLTGGELFAMIILLFVAGHETTTNLIGNGTLALLRQRDQFDALRADPSLASPGTDELLRFDSPVQVTVRTATEAVELNGLSLAKGESVVCGLAAGNRDPRYVDDPDRVILKRGAPTHLSFSNGMHHCLGAPLARLEGQVVFGTLARRFPDMVLATDDPSYRDHFVLRGLAALPVALRG